MHTHSNTQLRIVEFNGIVVYGGKIEHTLRTVIQIVVLLVGFVLAAVDSVAAVAAANWATESLGFQRPYPNLPWYS